MDEPPPDPARVQDSEAAALSELGDLVTAAEQRAGVRGDARLSSPVVRLLRVVTDLSPPTVTAAAETLGLRLSSTSRLVDRAVVAGLLRRRPSIRDRREVVLTRTRSRPSTSRCPRAGNAPAC